MFNMVKYCCAGTWDGQSNEQGTAMELSSIMSIDLSDFNGPILNGAVDGNAVIIKYMM